MVYCDLISCDKRDCIYHYKNAPWGEPITVKRYKKKQDKECKQYKGEDEYEIK